MHAILIAITLSLVAGRIAVVINPEGDSAMLSANDRSRWVTAAALVEQGTFAIDDWIVIKTPKGHRLWDTIDKVRHVGRDGRLHYYSSKPTLLTTLIAGVYAVVYGVTGMTLTDHPIYLPRLLLMLINLPTLALFLITTMLSIEKTDATDYTKRFCVTTACFGTMLTPFAISLNNHLFAAAATSLTLWMYVRTCANVNDSFSSVVYQPKLITWFIAGFSAAMAVACELPALSMFCLWGVLFAWIYPQSIPGFLFGAVVVAGGIFGTNYWAHQSWKTPYAHRHDGDSVEEFQWNETAGKSPATVAQSLRDSLTRQETLLAATAIRVRPLPMGGYAIIAEFGSGNAARQQQFKVAKATQFNADNTWRLLQWDDWYEYPGSYWRTDRRAGVDLGEPSRVAYLFHMTLGHYGIFSLTPVWFLVPMGMFSSCLHGRRHYRRLAAAITLSTVVCGLFYLVRPEIDRNYGGVSVCFRWMLWFIPLWIYAMIPKVDVLGENLPGRILAITLLVLSVFSVSASLDSPWQSPWLYRFASFLGWLS